MKFKTKPVIKEAFKWLHDEVPEWWTNAKGIQIEVQSGAAFIQTLEGTMRAEPGDWIIKGLRGEIYPCKPDIFEATYEPAE